MKGLLLFFLLSTFLSLIFSVLSLILTEARPTREKVSTFECGFNPIHYPGYPFSIRFFVIGVLFLVFDIEISLLFPWSSFSINMSLHGQSILIIFLLVLILGLIYEWGMGGLEWE